MSHMTKSQKHINFTCNTYNKQGIHHWESNKKNEMIKSFLTEYILYSFNVYCIHTISIFL